MAHPPLLGNKISLISRSEIRYEGILYTVDPKEATVALAKVKSLGTEDRPTARPVPPRDEVYEYIIFRASDIKDLHVCEPPKSAYGLSQDPAIVTYSQQYAYDQASYGGLPPMPHIASQASSAQIPLATSGYYAGSRTVPATQRKSPTSDAGVQVSVGGNVDYGRASRDMRDPLKPRNREQNQPNSQNRRRIPNRQSGRNASRRGRNRSSDSIQQFENEYDFEQANAEFLELENKLSKTNLEGTGEPSSSEELTGAYDKEKSFFDDISCEATQRSKGLPRFDWRYERKLNVETFGVSANNAWLRRRRARGGYRRNFRGRGSFNRTDEVPAQKTVTFDETPAVKEVEVISLEDKPDPLPVIEVISEKKEKEWPEPSPKTETVWN